jgi:phosphoglycolate phosphatase
MIPDLIAPQLILFDWDNTLVDSWQCIHTAMSATLTAMGQTPWTIEETRRRVALSLRNAFPPLFGDRWEEARDIYFHHYAANHKTSVVPLPGAVEMLTTLKGMGVPMAVVSNKTGSFLREEAQHLGWEHFFGHLVGAGDAHADKPHAAPVEMVLAASGVVAGDHVWFAGDAPVDMHCAVNSGCAGVLLRAHPPAEDEFAKHPPRHHFAAFEAVTGLVRGLLHPIS